jgi:hypothetical protein
MMDSVRDGDLTQEVLNVLKKEFGPLFRFEIDETPYYFRTITRAEMVALDLVDGEIGPDEEEDIFLLSCIWPDEIPEFDDIPAGIPSMVAQEVLRRSGVEGSEWITRYLERSKNSKTAFHSIAAVICAAFPRFLPSELDSMDIQKLMDTLVIAEEVIGIKTAIARGEYGELVFEDTEEANRELTDEEKDALIRRALESGIEGMPSGWVDRGKPTPPGANVMDPPGGLL